MAKKGLYLSLILWNFINLTSDFQVKTINKNLLFSDKNLLFDNEKDLKYFKIVPLYLKKTRTWVYRKLTSVMAL